MIDAPKVKRVLEIISANYEYILLDMPHDFSPTTLAGLDAADVILSVLTPDLASVRSAALALGVYENLGYPEKRVRLIQNWTFERYGLPRTEIENALGRKIDWVIP